MREKEVNKYKKILFDLDNTLIDDDANRSYAIKKILEEKTEEISQERIEEFIKIDNQFWKDRAAGKIKNPYEFKNCIISFIYVTFIISTPLIVLYHIAKHLLY